MTTFSEDELKLHDELTKLEAVEECIRALGDIRCGHSEKDEKIAQLKEELKSIEAVAEAYADELDRLEEVLRTQDACSEVNSHISEAKRLGIENMRHDFERDGYLVSIVVQKR